MHLAREGGTLKLLISGTAIGFGVYFANSIFNAFVQYSTMPVVVSAWLIPIMTFFLGVSYLTKIEDG
jgi:lipopolysaccharide export system permease protein